MLLGVFQSCEKCASLLCRCWIYTNTVRSPRSLVARGEACRGRCLILGSCTVSLPKHLGYSPSRSYSTIFICSSNSCGYRVHSYQPSYITGLLTENTSHNSSCHILILHQRSRQLLWVNTQMYHQIFNIEIIVHLFSDVFRLVSATTSTLSLWKHLHVLMTDTCSQSYIFVSASCVWVWEFVHVREMYIFLQSLYPCES